MAHRHIHKPHVHVHKPHVHVHKPRSPAAKSQKATKVPTLLRRGPTAGRRFIECMWQKYKGEEFWILGTGPSMDDYPDDFFNDKVSIGLKANFIVFPNTTFHITTVGKKNPRDKILFKPEVLKKHIFGLRTQKPRFEDRVPRKYRKLPVYMWEYRINVRWPEHRALLVEGVKRFMRKELIRFPHEDTISHLAIQAAAIMGAKKITLVGCEEQCVEHRLYAYRYRSFYGRRKFYVTGEKVKRFWKDGKRQRIGTRILAQALKRYGIEVALYHLRESKQFNTGYLGLN